MFFITDSEAGRLLYVSPAYERIWGRPAAELLADVSRFSEAVHPDDLPARREARAARARGEPATVEFRILRPDGEVRWILDRFFPIRSARGRLTAGSATDITERRRAEAATRESEARHRLLVESWAQAVWETDADGLVVTDSPSWRACTGQTLEESLGYGWLDAIHPDDRAHAERQWREAVAARGLVDAEFRLRAPDGGWRWTNIRAAPVPDAAGRVEKWVGMNIDIDARKRAEAALRESEERYRSLFNAVSQGLAINQLVRDGTGRVIDARYLDLNPAYEAQTGFERAKAVGRLASEIFPSVGPFWLEMAERVVSTGQAERIERFNADTGRWFAFDMAPFEGADQFVVLFDNVTDRKKAEIVLRESEERQAFLLSLSDALRPLADPGEIQAAATRLLREQFNGGWCYYVEFDRAGAVATVLRDSTRAGLPSLAGEHDVSDVPEFLDLLRSGGVLNVPDYAGFEPLSPRIRERYLALGFRSMLGAPLVKDGHPVALLLLADTEVRPWPESAVALVQETAERTWTALERARAEAATRASEAKYRTLFESIDEGFCLLELVRDPSGAPRDYRLLEVNPAFERQSGLVGATGKLRSELAAGADLEWLAIYDEVARTGEARRFDLFHDLTGRWYEAYAARVGDAGDRLCVVFNDVTERKRAEATLRESEERQAFLLALADTTRPLADPAEITAEAARVLGEHLRVNRAFYAEVEGDDWVVLKAYEQGVTPRAESRHPMAGFGRWIPELFRAGGRLVFADLHADPRFDPSERAAYAGYDILAAVAVPLVKGGRLVAILVVHSAVPRAWTELETALVAETAERTWAAMERARAEAATRESEARFRAAFEQANVGIVQASLDGHLLLPNPGFCRIIGRTAEETKTLTVRDITHPDEYDLDMAQAARVIAGEIPGYTMEQRYVRGDGEIVWVQMASSLVRDNAGAPSYALAIVEDITARKHAEAELLRANERFRLAEEAANGFVYDWDLRTGAARRSDGFGRVLGYGSGEVAETFEAWAELMHPDDRAAPGVLALAEALDREGAYALEYRVRRRGGGYAWVLDRGLVVRDSPLGGSGAGVRVVGTTVDITERKRAEIALRESEERQAFLLRLADALAPLADAAAIQATTARLLGAHLRVDRAMYAEVEGEAGAETGIIRGQYVRLAREGEPPLTPFPERFTYRPFGAHTMAARYRGDMLVVGDVDAAPAFGASDRAAWGVAGVRAAIVAPLAKGGRLVAEFGVHCAAPRAWTDAEVSLIRDVAERTWAAAERARAEAALRDSEARLRYIVEGARDYAIFATDAEGRITDWLAGAAAVFGWTAEEVTGQPVDITFTPEDRAAGAPAWERETARAEGVAPNIRWHLKRDGTRVFIDGATRALRDAEGRTRGFLKIGQDVTERRAAEAALRESEARFRTMAGAVGDVFYLTDLERGALLYLSPAYEQVWGRPPAELMADLGRFPDTIHPDDRRAVLAAQERQRRGKPVRIEYRVVRPDGTTRWILDRCFPVDGEVGRRSAGIATDITARVQAEAALRESEARLRQFGEASSDLLWIRHAATLRFDYVSPAFERIYGLRREDIIGPDDLTLWADLIVPEDRARVLGQLGKVRAGARVDFEFRIHRVSDGELRWIRNIDFPLRDADGRITRIGGIAQDVTEQRRVAAALAASEARFRGLAEGMPQLVWRAAAGGQWRWASPQWCAYTGQAEAETLGLGWLAAVHPDDHATTMAAWAEAPEHGLLDVRHRLRHAATGEWRWHQTRAQRVPGVPEREGDWLGTCTDVHDQVLAAEVLARSREDLEEIVAERTGELERAISALQAEAEDRIAAEEKLHQAQKMEAIGRLTGGIAHDFNNMLQGVTGALSLARRRIEDGKPERAVRFLDGAHEAAIRAAGLTRRLLAFARRQHLEPRRVAPDALVRDMAELVRRAIGPDINLEVHTNAGAAVVRCDPNELESAILNLCVNARDAMPSGGRLVISTAEVTLARADLAGEEGVAPGDFVEIAVEDTGTGMTPEVLARVTEPFFTTKPQGHGTGLGVSQVYGFAHQSGGLLRIESAPGRGTTVRILLPRRYGEAASDALAEPPPPLAPARGGTVLLVDDEAGVRGPVAERLRDLGLRVVEAGDGPEALRRFDETPDIDLVVSDVGLPGGMNGREVTEALRARRPGLPILFISGYSGDILPPGVEVLGKPFDLDDLARRVLGMLERRR